MNDKYDTLKSMCESVNIPEGKITDEFLFTIDATDLFFYKRNIGIKDIKYGFVDGANDGGIDFIYSDGDTMYLIQGKSSSSISIEDIKNVFDKMSGTVSKFDEKNYGQFSKRLKEEYLDEYGNLTDDKNIEFVLFTNTHLSEKMRGEIASYAKSDKVSDFTISVYDPKDFEEKEEEIKEEDSGLIPEDWIEMHDSEGNTNNVLTYGDPDKKMGIVINASASDINRLYAKYGLRGLFSYNLREHITQKSVDDGIIYTIKNEKENFWFYNNGITIGCEDFEKDGDRIRLYNFSIINGAQTTTQIGESKLINDKYDFSVVCKIVKGEKALNQDSDFITKISEASNSQKPIRPRDLKANAREQRKLQEGCEKNGKGKYSLAVEIKRGVHPANYNKVEKWQRVTNEYLGQLIYACILQHPGPARSNKNTIFTSNKIYNQLFLRQHDYDTLFDLVRIGEVYDEFVDDEVKKTEDTDIIAVLKNGKLVTLAIVAYLVKKQRGIIKNAMSSEVYKDNLTGFLVTDYPGDDLDKNLKSLFQFIVRKLKDLYLIKKDSLKLTSVSNFFKADQNYDEVIICEFDELDDYDQEKVATYMKIFSEKKDPKDQ